MQKLLLGMVLGALAATAAFGGTAALGKDKEGPCYIAPAAKDYPGDGAPARDIAAWMGEAAARAGLPPELPVIAAKARRIADGLPIDERFYGEWVADVQRPPEELRFRYQLRLAEARDLLLK